MPTAKSPAKERISIAFCFDDNLWMQAGVAIASLLYQANGALYDIYCVVPAHFAQSRRREIINIAKNLNADAHVVFLDANNDFDGAPTREYTTGIFYRFMLVKLLPKTVDKIIYADVDTVFCDSLADMYAIDMGENLIAGVADADQGRPFPAKHNGYINSGVLIMNMAQIRRQKLYDVWHRMAMAGGFRYADQDILNKTCDGRILYLPPRYNYMPGPGGRFAKTIENGIYSARAVFDAQTNPAIIHFILRRPWLGHDNLCADQWWRYAAMTPFYAAFRAKIDTAPDVVETRVLLFAAIPLLKIKYMRDNVRCLLFGKIPLYRCKRTVKKRGL